MRAVVGALLCVSFELLDLGKLTRGHLLHQVENRLLSDFPNLYELHEGRVVVAGIVDIP